MAAQLPLHPNNSAQLRDKTHSFIFEKVKLIYKLYIDDNFALTEVKESSFIETQLPEIAVFINHGE